MVARAEKDCRVSVNQSSMQQHKPVVGVTNEAEAEHGDESRNGYSNKPTWEEPHRGLPHQETPYGQGLAYVYFSFSGTFG
jgi:hypothetical protein